MIDNQEIIIILTAIGAVLSLIGAVISLSSLFQKNNHQKHYQSPLNKAHK